MGCHNETTDIDTERYYQALLTHSAHFDGVFCIGVSATRISCRLVCTARPARPDRCTFYAGAVAAERAGFRPRLPCRPELGPDRDVETMMARQAAPR